MLFCQYVTFVEFCSYLLHRYSLWYTLYFHFFFPFNQSLNYALHASTWRAEVTWYYFAIVHLHTTTSFCTSVTANCQTHWHRGKEISITDEFFFFFFKKKFILYRIRRAPRPRSPKLHHFATWGVIWRSQFWRVPELFFQILEPSLWPASVSELDLKFMGRLCLRYRILKFFFRTAAIWRLVNYTKPVKTKTFSVFVDVKT